MYTMAVPRPPMGRKRREKGRKEGNSSKEEGKYPYFVSLFNIGPYDRL